MSERNAADDSDSGGGDAAPPPKLRKAILELSSSNESDESENEEDKDEDRLHSLASFGYSYNQAGELRDLSSGDLFKFDVYPDRSRNQKRYEAIGELVTEYIYQMMENAGLKRIVLPVDASEEEPASFIFVSNDMMTNADKLMILIHGSGIVRAGQWSRRLAMNENLDTGSQLPFIKKAMNEGYAIVVMNTNYNKGRIGETKSKTKIRGNDSPEKHAVYVWDNIISKTVAKHIAIVAHSYGGVVTFKLTSKRGEEVMKRVFAIAFTDSVHAYSSSSLSPKADEWMRKVGMNWVSSHSFLDTSEDIKGRTDVPRVSAGTSVHEKTSSASMASIFKFIGQKYTEVVTPPSDEL